MDRSGRYDRKVQRRRRAGAASESTPGKRTLTETLRGAGGAVGELAAPAHQWRVPTAFVGENAARARGLVQFNAAVQMHPDQLQQDLDALDTQSDGNIADDIAHDAGHLEEAEAAYQQGQAAYRAHDYVRAGQLFERAAAANRSERGSALYNAALAYGRALLARSGAHRPEQRRGPGGQLSGADLAALDESPGESAAAVADHATAHEDFDRGIDQYRAGDDEDAARSFQDSAARAPEAAGDLQYNAGMALCRAGNYAAAIRSFRAALGLGDGAPQAPDSSAPRGAVQRQQVDHAPAGDEADDVHQLADVGTRGAGGALPHAAAIQRAFGRHDVGGITAHVGGAAAEASRAMGAQAYASGDHVAFASSPDLHLAAHEAAHVVQQRGGVALKSGVGEVGDAHERHADEVADHVVRGESAESLLDQYQGGNAAPSVQRWAETTELGVSEREMIRVELDIAHHRGQVRDIIRGLRQAQRARRGRQGAAGPDDLVSVQYPPSHLRRIHPDDIDPLIEEAQQRLRTWNQEPGAEQSAPEPATEPAAEPERAREAPASAPAAGPDEEPAAAAARPNAALQITSREGHWFVFNRAALRPEVVQYLWEGRIQPTQQELYARDDYMMRTPEGAELEIGTTHWAVARNAFAARADLLQQMRPEALRLVEGAPARRPAPAGREDEQTGREGDAAERQSGGGGGGTEVAGGAVVAQWESPALTLGRWGEVQFEFTAYGSAHHTVGGGEGSGDGSGDGGSEPTSSVHVHHGTGGTSVEAEGILREYIGSEVPELADSFEFQRTPEGWKFAAGVKHEPWRFGPIDLAFGINVLEVSQERGEVDFHIATMTGEAQTDVIDTPVGRVRIKAKATLRPNWVNIGRTLFTRLAGPSAGAGATAGTVAIGVAIPVVVSAVWMGTVIYACMEAAEEGRRQGIATWYVTEYAHTFAASVLGVPARGSRATPGSVLPGAYAEISRSEQAGCEDAIEAAGRLSAEDRATLRQSDYETIYNAAGEEVARRLDTSFTPLATRGHE